MADTEYTREQRLLNACKAAAEWLEGWVSAEPYLSELRSAISEFESTAPPVASLGEQEGLSIEAAVALVREKANAAYGYGPKGSRDEFDRCYSLSPLQLATAINAALPSASLGEQREAVIAAHNALEVLLDWDRSRDFIVPYKVRDPIHVAMKQLRSVLAASPASKGAGGGGERDGGGVQAPSRRCAGCDLPNGCPEHCWCDSAGAGKAEYASWFPARPLGTSPDQQKGGA